MMNNDQYIELLYNHTLDCVSGQEGTHFLELRALVDHLVASLPRDSVSREDMPMKNPLRTQLSLFATTVPPAKISSEERVEVGAAAVSSRRSSVRAGCLSSDSGN
jgi:hypothetical protein